MSESVSNYILSAKKTATKIINFAADKKFLTVFIIASLSVVAALLQTRNYLNPSRNEELYQEEVLKINYSKIDDEIVEELLTTQEDENIEVDPLLVPNRNNPFAE